MWNTYIIKHYIEKVSDNYELEEDKEDDGHID